MDLSSGCSSVRFFGRFGISREERDLLALLGYYDVFPDKASTDLRVAYFTEDMPESPILSGAYVFTEYYCNDLACDCQRLLIKCLYHPNENSKPEEVATFSYTWDESLAKPWAEILGDVDNPFFDPLHFQAPCAAELMDFWHDMFCRDQRYANRLKSHYFELREKFGVQAEMPMLVRPDAAQPNWESPMDRKRRYQALHKSQTKRPKHKR